MYLDPSALNSSVARELSESESKEMQTTQPVLVMGRLAPIDTVLVAEPLAIISRPASASIHAGWWRNIGRKLRMDRPTPLDVLIERIKETDCS